AVFSCHGLKKLAFHYGAVEAEFASAAEKSSVHSALSVRNCLNQHIAVSLQMHGASNRTVRACSIHSFCIQRNRFLQGEILLKSACGAYAYALAAGDTSCLGKRLLESRHNNCIKSTFHKTESSYAHNLVAGTNTESAEDTLVGI